MFAKSNLNVGVSQRVVATLVACATVLLSIGAFHTAQAANFTSVSDTLSDSAPTVTSAHTIEFTVPASGGTAIGLGDNITIDFPTGGVFSGVASVSGANTTVSVNTVAQGAASVSASGDTITITNVAVAAGDVVEVAINDGIITNPTVTESTSYRLEIASSVGDSGSTMVAILPTVLVTASVNTQFTFLVSGVDAGVAINGETTTGTSSTTTIPFGEIAADTKYVMGQSLSVLTNALNGFSVTVETDGDLRSNNGADIDTFIDGADTIVASNWVGNEPAATVGVENTYGHWGMTYEDTTLNGGVVLGASQYIAASTTPRQVFYHNGPADGTLTGTGTAQVAYAVEISPLQEAADDYQSILTYIATPTF